MGSLSPPPAPSPMEEGLLDKDSTISSTASSPRRRGVRETVFCLFGTVTFIVGFVLIVLAVFFMSADPSCPAAVQQQALVQDVSSTAHAQTSAPEVTSGSVVAAHQKGARVTSNETPKEAAAAETPPMQADDSQPLHYLDTRMPNMSFEHLRDLAAGRPCQQSSTVHAAGLATDGHTSNALGDGSCAQTDWEQRPFWYVDLGRPSLVKRLTLLLPRDCCAGELHNFEVRIGQQEELSDNILCRYYLGASLQVALMIECPNPTYGRYVSIQVMGGEDRKSRLSLCEVKVYER